jgi:hypothetical protein
MRGEDFAVAATPNGRNVCAASYLSRNPDVAGIAVFEQSHVNGGLAQLRGAAGCVT